MANYNGYKIEEFLKEAREWEDELNKLQGKLDAITEISGASDDPGHSTEISKPVERTAIARENILARMDEIKVNIEALNIGLESISEYDRELILGFFFGDKAKAQFEKAWSMTHKSNRQYCYNDRRKAIEHLSIHVRNYRRLHGYDLPEDEDDV